MRPLLRTLAAILGVVIQWTAPQPHALSLSQWEAQPGDFVIVDTAENMIYLVHQDGGYLADVAGSGQRGVVNYGKFGRINAETPEGVWRVKSTTIQNDRATFGPTGLFLRLHEGDSGDPSPLGFHDVANNDDLLASVDRYWSMGCILVRADMLDLLTEEYELQRDAGGLLVVTTRGFDGKQPLTLAQAR